MIQSILGAPSIGQLFTASPITPLNVTSESGDDLASSGSVSEPDQLPFSQGADTTLLTAPDLLSAQSLQAGLRIHSRTQLKVGDDGDLALKSFTKLRFRYEFATDDGLRIQLNAKAKIQFSYKQDDNDTLQLRSKVKIEASLVQESVGSELTPLLESEDLSAAEKTDVAAGLEEFLALVDEITNQFLSGDDLDGDGLIVGLVDAFNELVDAVNSLFAPQDDGPLDAPTDTPLVEQVEAADGQPVIAANIEPAVLPAVDAGDAGPAGVAIEPVDVVDNVENPEPDEADDVSGNNPEIAESEIVEEGDDTAAVTSPEVEDTPDSEPVPLYQQVLVNLRLKFVQSLSRLVSVFDSASAADQLTAQPQQILRSHSLLRLDAQATSIQLLAPNVQEAGTTPTLDVNA